MLSVATCPSRTTDEVDDEFEHRLIVGAISVVEIRPEPAELHSGRRTAIISTTLPGVEACPTHGLA